MPCAASARHKGCQCRRTPPRRLAQTKGQVFLRVQLQYPDSAVLPPDEQSHEEGSQYSNYMPPAQLCMATLKATGIPAAPWLGIGATTMQCRMSFGAQFKRHRTTHKSDDRRTILWEPRRSVRFVVMLNQTQAAEHG